MGAKKAAESLKKALIGRFGASAKDVIGTEVDVRLAGKSSLTREDVDAIERGIITAMRQRRQAQPTPPPSAPRQNPPPPGTLPPCAGSRSLSSLTAAVPLSVDPSRVLSRSMSDTRVPKPPYAKMDNDDARSDCSRVTVRPVFPVPKRSKIRAVDHWDLLVAFDTQKYMMEQASDTKAGPRGKKITQKSWLDGQMLEVHGNRQLESDNRRLEAETMRLQIAENKRQEQEEKQKEHDQKALVKKLNDEMGEMLGRRQRRIDDKKKKEEDAMTAWLAEEKRQEQEDRERKAVEYAEKCSKARAELELVRTMRQERLMQEREQEKKMCEEQRRVMDENEAKKRAEVKAREDWLAKIAATLGEQMGNENARIEREIEERCARVQAEFDRQAAEKARIKKETHERKVKEMLEIRAEQTREFKARGEQDKRDNKKQAEIWQKQYQDSCREEEEKVAKAKRARAEQDESLMVQIRHNADIPAHLFGLSAKQQEQELAYNRALFQQMADRGFATDTASMFLSKASDKGRLMPYGSVAEYEGEIHPLEMHAPGSHD